MIYCDYKLNYLSSNVTELFTTPKLLREFPNTSHIKGPNSSGKSTFLNIFALAFREDQNLHPTVRKKIEYLKEQDLEFQIRIVQDISGEEIVLKKDAEGPITIKRKLEQDENYETITSDRFHRLYELIYEIPDNPLGKLKELINQVEGVQQRLNSRIGNLKNRLYEIINQIRKKPPKTTEEIKKELSGICETRSKYEKNIGEKKSEIHNLTMIRYLSFYDRSNQILDKKVEWIKKLTKEKRRSKNIQSSQYKNLKKIQDEIVSLRTDFKSHYMSLKEYSAPIFSADNKDLLREIYDRDIEEDLKSSRTDFTGFTDAILNRLDEIKSENDFDINQNEIMFLEQLKKLLDHTEGLDYKFPEIEITISEFKKIIEDQLKKLQPKIQFQRSFKSCQKVIVFLNKDYKKTREKFGQLKEIKKISPDLNETDFVGIESQLKEYEYEKTEQERYLRKYKQELIKLGISVENITKTLEYYKKEPSSKNYFKLTKYEFDSEIKKLNEDLSQINDRNDGIVIKIKMLETDLKKAKTYVPHEYENNYKQLEEYYNLCTNLQKKFGHEYQKFIEIIKTDPLEKLKSEKKENEALSRYADQVAIYLAKVIKTVQHINKQYNLEKVDLINEEFITSDGKRINFLDFGTGQSQSAYLLGQLRKSHTKKLLVLFDEIAQMDNKSLIPIYKEIVSLYKTGKLILGLLVQTGEDFKVVDFSNAR